jgi:hypothetical protein
MMRRAQTLNARSYRSSVCVPTSPSRSMQAALQLISIGNAHNMAPRSHRPPSIATCPSARSIPFCSACLLPPPGPPQLPSSMVKAKPSTTLAPSIHSPCASREHTFKLNCELPANRFRITGVRFVA